LTISVSAIGITALLTLGFASVGEALLGRDSRDLFAWNESLLIGMGICAAALFPLSLLWPHGALRAELWLMGLSGLALLRRRLASRGRSATTQAPGGVDETATEAVAFALLASIVAVVITFVALDLRYPYLWDGFQIWATKAQLLFAAGGLGRSWFQEEIYDSRVLCYPALVPLWEALLCVVEGRFDFDLVKPVFLPFLLCMLVSAYAATRTVASRRWSLATTLLLVLLPPVCTRYSAGGYADMPQAAIVAGVVAAGLRPNPSCPAWRGPLPWLIGSLSTVKSEGMALVALACAGVLIYAVTRRPRRLPPWGGVLVVALFVGLRMGYLGWLGIHDTTYGPFDAQHFSRLPSLLARVPLFCLRIMLDPLTWGLFWPAFLLAVAVVAADGSGRLKCLAASTAAGLVVYAAIFLFTNWEVRLHIAQAYERLLLQLTPAAAVVIGAAGQRIWSREDLPRGEA
jgi:hypothetical protein